MQQLVKPDKTNIFEAPHYFPFARGIHRWLFHAPHKRPVMWKAFPCQFSWLTPSTEIDLEDLDNCLRRASNSRLFMTNSPLTSGIPYNSIKEEILTHILTFMMTSSNGNIFRVTGPLWGEFTRHRWIPLTKASDAELWCFLWSKFGKPTCIRLKMKLNTRYIFCVSTKSALPYWAFSFPVLIINIFTMLWKWSINFTSFH